MDIRCASVSVIGRTSSEVGRVMWELGREAFVTETLDDATTVYDKAAESQGPEAMAELARTLSAGLGSPAVWLICDDTLLDELPSDELVASEFLVAGIVDDAKHIDAQYSWYRAENPNPPSPPEDGEPFVLAAKKALKSRANCRDLRTSLRRIAKMERNRRIELARGDPEGQSFDASTVRDAISEDLGLSGALRTASSYAHVSSEGGYYLPECDVYPVRATTPKK